MHQIVVIGAGPIGSYLAQTLAGKGYKVLVLEQEKKAGDNVCCTGLISKECFDKLNLENSLNYREFCSARLIGPAERIAHFQRKSTVAYAVDRPGLNILLADRAASAGACFQFSSKVIDVQVKHDSVQVQIARINEVTSLKAKLVILATGFNFGLVKRLGFFNTIDFTVGAQCKVTIQKCAEPEIYINKSLIPDGFGWLIPTSSNTGLSGILCQHKPKHFFNKFQSCLQSKGKISSSSSRPQFGIIPLKALKTTCGDRIIILGEAAGQVKPTTGGGIYYGLLCAEIAANVIHEGFKKNDFSQNQLSNYEKQWRRLLKSELRTGYLLHTVWKKLKNQNLVNIIDIIHRLKIEEKINMSKDFEFDWHSKLLRRMANLIITPPL